MSDLDATINAAAYGELVAIRELLEISTQLQLLSLEMDLRDRKLDMGKRRAAQAVVDTMREQLLDLTDPDR